MSLKEQLLKAGLVTEDQVKASEEAQRKAKTERRQGRQPSSGKSKAKRPNEKVSGDGKRKVANDLGSSMPDELRYRPAKNPQRIAKPGTAARKAQLNAIKYLIKKHRANTDAADQDFNFVSSNKIRKVRVTSAQAKALATGKQVLLRNPQDSFDYVILPIPVALEISETEKHAILVWNGAEGDKYWADEEAAKLANRAAHQASQNRQASERTEIDQAEPQSAQANDGESAASKVDISYDDHGNDHAHTHISASSVTAEFDQLTLATQECVTNITNITDEASTTKAVDPMVADDNDRKIASKDNETTKEMPA